jgi:transposase-like protein
MAFLDETPSGYADRTCELLDQILESSSQASARECLEAVTSELEEKAPAALEVLEDGFFDATAVLALPGKYQRRLRTTNSLERLIQEIRRREKVIRIFPSRSSAWRLIGALLAETHEEWSTGRRYLKMDAFEEWRREQARPDPSQPDAEPKSEPTSHSMQPA